MGEQISLAKAYEQQFNASFHTLPLKSKKVMEQYMRDEKMTPEQKKWADDWIHDVAVKAEHLFDHQNDPIPVSKRELQDDNSCFN